MPDIQKWRIEFYDGANDVRVVVHIADEDEEFAMLRAKSRLVMPEDYIIETSKDD